MPDESIDDVLKDVLFDGQTIPDPPAPTSSTRDKRQVVENAKAVRLVTATTFVREGFEVVDTLPMVHARRAYGTSGWKDMMISMRDALGGRSKTTEEIVERLERELRTELQLLAAHKGATVVSGFRLDVSMFEGTMFLGRAYGTPLVVRKLAEAPEPV